jgi:hypothetical protein
MNQSLNLTTPPAVLNQFSLLYQRIEAMSEQIDQHLAQANAKLDAMEANFTGIAGDIAFLKAELGKLSPEDQAKLAAFNDRLTTMGERTAAIDAETPPSDAPST